MAIIDTKICKYKRPPSFYDASLAEFEYFLAWKNADGGWYSYLFQDFTKSKNVSGEIINRNSDNINKLFRKIENSTLLVAEDIDENQLSICRGIMSAKEIRRYYLDNSFDKVSIITDSDSYKKSGFRYNFTIEIAEKDSVILK